MIATRIIDRFVDVLGKSVAWLLFAMVGLTGCVVVLRYGFDIGAIFLQETVVYLHGLAFLVGLSYALQHDGHVRVDLVYSKMSAGRKDLINLAGHLLFMLPLAITIAWISLPYAAKSWAILEGSPEVGGLQAVFLLKSVIPFAAILLALQSASLAVQLLLNRGKSH